MRFAATQEGETLSDLAERLYRPPDERSLRKIVKLIGDANPNLKGRKKILEGTVVVVPDVPDLEPRSGAYTEREVAASLLESARNQIGDLREILDPLVDRRAEDAMATIQLARSREVRRVAKAERIVEERLDEITKSSGEEIGRAKTIRKVSVKAVQELESDLDELLARLDRGRVPPPKSKTPRAKKK